MDDVTGKEIIALLEEHVRCMREVHNPSEYCAVALNLEQVRHPDVTFWSVWEGPELAGCGAIKALDETHAELKSMRTAEAHQRKGVAKLLLQHIINESRKRGFKRVSLETGSVDYFSAARHLYHQHGFEECEPFADYVVDPHSIFMTIQL